MDIDFFIDITCFIKNILRFAHNQYKSPQSSTTASSSNEFAIKKWINNDAIDASTISRRVDFVDDFFKEQQKHVHSSIDIKSKWLDRQIRIQAPWLMQHKLLLAKRESEFQQREKEYWNQYKWNPQRLLNVVYASINCHLSARAIFNYRKAVSDVSNAKHHE